jgi:hypothetical protein
MSTITQHEPFYIRIRWCFVDCGICFFT